MTDSRSRASPAASSPLAVPAIMLGLALSETNSRRLQDLVSETSPRPCLDDDEGPLGSPPRLLDFAEAAEGLSKAANERSRHDALLQLVATLLSRPLDQEFEQLAAAPSVVQALIGVARPLSEATDNCFAIHALVAELVLAALDLLSRSELVLLDNQALVLMTAYTDINDPWTTQSSASMATGLLASRMPHDKLAPFIVGPVLQAYVRPIFSQSSGAALRSGGQDEAMDAGRRHVERARWKEQDPLVASVFRWAVRNADASLIASNWHLFLPVLLTLIEDCEVSERERGLANLIQFLQKCPPDMLLRTGLRTLSQDAVFPLLVSLPGAVEAQQYEASLGLAYSVLLQLAKADRDPRLLRRRRLLDRVIRDGVLVGHSASTHAVATETLMRYLAAAVDCLGIFAAKHLQNLFQIIGSVMTDPFATARPSTVVASGKALNSLVSNCWPRMVETVNTERVLRMITICWVNSYDQATAREMSASDDVARIHEELLLTSRILRSIWRGHLPENAQHQLSGALLREPKLRPLLHHLASP